MVRQKMTVLAGALLIGMAGVALADDAKAPLGSEQNLGGAPNGQENALDSGRSSTRDTGIGRDEKLNVGPGAKSDLPVPARTPGPDKMSSPD
jgi:hypothetical protein